MKKGIQKNRIFLSVILLACQTIAVADEISLEALREQVAGSETAGLLFFTQPQRATAFKHIRDLYPTRVIKAGTSPYPLADHPADFSAMTY